MLIAIGIPFYNAEKYLDLAIQSVLAQTYKDWKLLLVDDGSTDQSLSIANKYRNDPRIIVYSDGENRSLPFRLNQITNIANTKYLARMDADDIMHPERIEKQIQYLENNSSVDIIGSNAFIIDETGTVNGLRYQIDQDCESFDVRSFIHPSITGKTVWFKENPYDNFAIRIEDAELWYRTKKYSSFKCLSIPLLYYREFGGEYYKKYKKSLGSYIYVMKKYFFQKRYNDSFIWFLKYTISIIKYILYRSFHFINKEDVLIKGRKNRVVK